MGERMRGLVTPKSRGEADAQSAALASQCPVRHPPPLLLPVLSQTTAVCRVGVPR